MSLVCSFPANAVRFAPRRRFFYGLPQCGHTGEDVVGFGTTVTETTGVAIVTCETPGKRSPIVASASTTAAALRFAMSSTLIVAIVAARASRRNSKLGHARPVRFSFAAIRSLPRREKGHT
jgi:hypothetical protein